MATSLTKLTQTFHKIHEEASSSISCFGRFSKENLAAVGHHLKVVENICLTNLTKPLAISDNKAFIDIYDQVKEGQRNLQPRSLEDRDILKGLCQNIEQIAFSQINESLKGESGDEAAATKAAKKAVYRQENAVLTAHMHYNRVYYANVHGVDIGFPVTDADLVKALANLQKECPSVDPKSLQKFNDATKTHLEIEGKWRKLEDNLLKEEIKPFTRQQLERLGIDLKATPQFDKTKDLFENLQAVCNQSFKWANIAYAVYDEDMVKFTILFDGAKDIDINEALGIGQGDTTDDARNNAALMIMDRIEKGIAALNVNKNDTAPSALTQTEKYESKVNENADPQKK